MSQHVQAIFEGGVLRPLGPVDLREREVVVVSIEKTADAGATESAEKMSPEQRQAILALLDEMERMPGQSPADDFSHRDIDRIVYGIK
jgi:predicted DNA-binding antitoxin AbrB/MazE fold protein